MLPTLAVALCLIVSWLILRQAEPIADYLGLIDRPTEMRKIHARPTPRMGGTSLVMLGLVPSMTI
jgi:UDP-N-acetylmuramyl pentapeptide phosphotransferase/UDP-N-acetylglucosamine-1-phosphate transferase